MKQLPKELKIIKTYWEKRLPQIWYSDKKPMSKEWFNELEFSRYNAFYEYIKQIAEFEYHSGEKVLEIGVGVGTDLLQYAKNGSKVYGIDLTKEAIAITKQHFKEAEQKYVHLSIGNAEELSFKDNTFDLIFCFGVLHHIPNTSKAIKEIHRVLKPGGKAIIMLYAVGWKHIVKRIIIRGILCGQLFKLGYQKCINKNTEVHGDSPLTKVYTKRGVRKLFPDFGEISIERYRLGEYFDYAPYKSKKFPSIITKLIYSSGLVRFFGENWIIKAKKVKEQKGMSFWKTLLKP